MRISQLWIVLILLSTSSVGFGQIKPNELTEWDDQIRIKKNLLVHGLENQLKDVNFAAPRVLARYTVSSWLWKNRKDDTGRAEELAVLAVEDLFRNRTEVPPPYFESLGRDLFALLDRNAPIVSKKLKTKYSLDTSLTAGIVDSLLSQPGSERPAVDAAIRTLLSEGDTGPQLATILHTLHRRGSTELVRLLEAVLLSEESGRVRFSATSMVLMSQYFGGASVPTSLSRRFGRIVLQKARYTSQQPTGPFETMLELLSSNLPIISRVDPELLPEVSVVQAVLTTRIAQASRLERERNERINNSSDKLAALISEAEGSEDNNVKYEFYVRAARLAASQGACKKAVDLMILAMDVDSSTNPISEDTRRNEQSRFFSEVMDKALKLADDESAQYSIDKMFDPIHKSESYLRLTKYYIENGKAGAARDSLLQSLRFAATVEDLARRAGAYLLIHPVARTLDPTSVPEINALVAKTVNSIPSLNVEDKPETDNYRKHVIAVMIVNWHLLPALRTLAEKDRNGATDLTSRIDRKEVRVPADAVLETTFLEAEVKNLKKSKQTTSIKTP